MGYDSEMYSGTVDFSATKYWDDGNYNLVSPYDANGASYYGNPYPYVYNNTYITEPDFSSECDYSTNCYNTPGYSIAYYVEQYKTRLIEMGAPSTITGRLLSHDEAENVQEVGREDIEGYDGHYTSIIFTGQDYWLGDSSGVMDTYGFSGDNRFGVRPVIEIPTSEIR